MKSRKLMQLSQQKRLEPQIQWLRAAAAAQHQPVEASDLLQISFVDWCHSLRIKTPDGLAPFKMFDWQRETAELIAGENAVKGRQIVVLSSRQTGKTSLFLALMTYFSLAREQFTGVLIHKTQKDSGQLARRVKLLMPSLKLTTDNLSLFEFPTGSMLHFRSANPSRGAEGAEGAGRGTPSADCCFIDEAAFLSNLKDVLGVIGPALTWGSPKISALVSTAGSKTGHYYSLLAEAAGGSEKLEALLEGIRQGTEKPFQILNREGPGPIGVISNWRCIPEFAAEPDFLGRIQAELNISDSQVASEFEMVFSAAVDSAVFGFNLVMAAQSEEISPPKQYDVIYCGCDPAGQGKDYACFLALRKVEENGKSIYEVCDLYRKRTGVAEQHLNALIQKIDILRPLAVTIEKNSMGQIWLENLAGYGGTVIEGFTTSASSKPMLIGRLQIALERGVLRIPKGSVIVDELLAFRRTDAGKLEAGGNAHDDTVMALALSLSAAKFNINR